jgi:hypothetical protein
MRFLKVTAYDSRGAEELDEEEIVLSIPRSFLVDEEDEERDTWSACARRRLATLVRCAVASLVICCC